VRQGQELERVSIPREPRVPEDDEQRQSGSSAPALEGELITTVPYVPALDGDAEELSAEQRDPPRLSISFPELDDESRPITGSVPLKTGDIAPGGAREAPPEPSSGHSAGALEAVEELQRLRAAGLGRPARVFAVFSASAAVLTVGALLAAHFGAISLPAELMKLPYGGYALLVIPAALTLLTALAAAVARSRARRLFHESSVAVGVGGGLLAAVVALVPIIGAPWAVGIGVWFLSADRFPASDPPTGLEAHTLSRQFDLAQVERWLGQLYLVIALTYHVALATLLLPMLRAWLQ
jgi:hypothetical protein